MATILEGNNYLTLINVFKVHPEKQDSLVELLKRANTTVRRAPGFVSASLHRSLDGTKVTMYAQWKSLEEYDAMRSNPAAMPFLEKALEIAQFEPGMYEVVETVDFNNG
jgi:quinol monooxygenase YgiN